MGYDAKFSKEETNVCKGVAICLMIFHHLFYSEDSWARFYQAVHIGTRPLLSIFALHGKICVTIFVFLSAYGLAVTAQSRSTYGLQIPKHKAYLHFVFSHVKKLYFLYWPVFIPAMMIGILSGKSSPISIYRSIGQWIRDLFGVAYILDGVSPFNGAWWYIGFAITLYMVFPLVNLLVCKAPKVMLILSFLVGARQLTQMPILIEWQRYFFVCCLGIYLAQNNLLSWLCTKGARWKRILAAGGFCAVFFVLRTVFPFTLDAFFALAVIVMSVSIFNSRSFATWVILSLGKYSGTMFLVHGLLYKNFLQELIYGFWYPSLIFCVLLVLSYGISVGIRYVQGKAAQEMKRLFKIEN